MCWKQITRKRHRHHQDKKQASGSNEPEQESELVFERMDEEWFNHVCVCVCVSVLLETKSHNCCEEMVKQVVHTCLLVLHLSGFA